MVTVSLVVELDTRYTRVERPRCANHTSLHLAHTRAAPHFTKVQSDTTMCSHHWARAAALRRPAGQHTQLRKGQARGKQGKAGRRGTVVMECQDPKRAVDLDNDHDKHNDKVLRFVSRTRG